MYILTSEIRNEFIDGLRPKYARLLTTKLIGSVNDIVWGAKELYLSGTPFHNRGANRQIRMNDKDKLAVVLDPLCVKIWHYFYESPTPCSQDDFDIIHKEFCDLFIDIFKKEGYTHTYGNAQKFINMLFKYLSCYNDVESSFSEKFKYCHMTLDRFTYNGYRIPFYKNVVYPAIHGCSPNRLTAWSQLSKEEYINAISDITAYVSSHPKTYNDYLDICADLPIFTQVPRLSSENNYILTPFEVEFFVWAIAKCCQEKDSNYEYIYNSSFVNRIKSLL